MSMKREASMSVFLVSLLFGELACYQVSRWRLGEEQCTEMRLRRVLGELVTLSSGRGPLAEMAKEREVDELLAITKLLLFGQSRQWGTRRNGWSLWNPATWFGNDPKKAFGGIISAGVVASGNGIWAGIGGGIGQLKLKQKGKNDTNWPRLDEQPSAIGIGDIDFSPGGFTEPAETFEWNLNWSPPTSQTPVTAAWMQLTDAATGSSTSKNPKGDDLGNPMLWKPTSKPHWEIWATTKPPWNFGPTTQPTWDFGFTTRPTWDFGPTSHPSWFAGLKTADPFLKKTASGHSDAVATPIPPWKGTNNTNFLPTSKPGSPFFARPKANGDSAASTKAIPPWRKPGGPTRAPGANGHFLSQSTPKNDSTLDKPLK